MAFISFDDSLGFGARVTSATGTLLPPSQIVSDGPGTTIDAGTAFTTSGSFNQGAITYTIAGAYVSGTTVRLDSITYATSAGTPILVVGSMNLFWAITTETSASALSRLLSGNDAIFGNRFADYIEAGTGNDRIVGYGGNDTLLGEGNNDFLNGHDGNDLVIGGLGADTVQGGAGIDLLTGAKGRDVFRFVNLTDSRPLAIDRITDFTRDEDRIDLSLMDAFTATRANDAFIFRGTGAFRSSTAGEVRYQKIDAAGTANDRTLVYLDTDADSTAEGVIRLNGLHDLRATDFIL